MHLSKTICNNTWSWYYLKIKNSAEKKGFCESSNSVKNNVPSSSWAQNNLQYKAAASGASLWYLLITIQRRILEFDDAD